MIKVLMESKSYKIVHVTEHPNKAVKYVFKHNKGVGYVVATPKGTGETVFDFAIKQSDKTPDTKHAARVLRTVAKVVRYHAAKNKLKKIGFFALPDQHDSNRKPGSNRRLALYTHMMRKRDDWKDATPKGAIKGRKVYVKVKSRKSK